MNEPHVSEEDLTDFVQGQFGPLEERRIERHVHGCPACAKRLSAEAYAELVMESAAARVRLPHDVARSKKVLSPRKLTALAAAAVVVLGGFATWKGVAWGPAAIRPESNLGMGPRLLPVPDDAWRLSGAGVENMARFETGIDPAVLFGASPARALRTPPSASGESGELMQMFQATKYLGKRVRFSVQLKTKDVTYGVGIWIQVQKLGPTWRKTKLLDMVNTPAERAIVRTTDWATYDMAVDVPSDASIIMITVSLAGAGQVWMAEPKFESIGPSQEQVSGIAPGPSASWLPPDFRP